jgi:hypothetical protein
MMLKHAALLLLTLSLSLVVASAAHAQEPIPLPTPLPSAEPSPLPIPSPGTEPSYGEQYVAAPLERFFYMRVRDLTSGVWSLNKGVLLVANLFHSIRGVTGSLFVSTLAVIGQSLVVVFSAMTLLGVLLGLLSALVQPWFQFMVSSARRGIVAALLVPTILGGMGGMFTMVELVRTTLASAVSGLSFDGALGELGTVLPPVYNPEAAPNRAMDVTAAFLFFTPDDIAAQEPRLPTAFAAAMYTPPPTNWERLTSVERDAYMAQALTGLGRMAFGSIPVIVVLLESVTQLALTVACGTLFVFLAVALCFAVFGPAAQQASGLAYLVFNLSLFAIQTSGIQGVLLAVLVWGWSTNIPEAVIGAAILVLGCDVLLLWATFGLLRRVMFVSFGSLSEHGQDVGRPARGVESMVLRHIPGAKQLVAATSSPRRSYGASSNVESEASS